MKNKIYSLLLTSILLVSFSITANADTVDKQESSPNYEISKSEQQNQFNNSIEIYAKAGLAKNYTYWKIQDEGNGFKIVPAADLKAWTLDTKTTFKIYDENSNIVFNKIYDNGTSMKAIANDLFNIRMNYNSSFQIIPNKWETVLRIKGHIGNNIDNHDYGIGINNSRASQIKFRLDPNGTLIMEKINEQGLSFLNNRFAIETTNLGVDTYTTNLKLSSNYTGGYKLTFENMPSAILEKLKSPFAIAIYNNINGNVGGLKHYVEIPAHLKMTQVNDLLNAIPPIYENEYIQFIPAGTNLPGTGTPKIYIKGGVINNINFYNYSNGLDAYRGSITAFKLTNKGLEATEFTH